MADTKVKKEVYMGTGRRKTSVARVRIMEGSGKFDINGRSVENFFTETKDRNSVVAPLVLCEQQKRLDVIVKVHGGGYTGQAGALVQGLGRALSMFDPSLRPGQKEGGFLTRDSRMKERKKYGQRGARRRFQFSKR